MIDIDTIFLLTSFIRLQVLLLPMGRADDGAHSINEKLDRSNYVQGIKLMAAYLHEIGDIAA